MKIIFIIIAFLFGATVNGVDVGHTTDFDEIEAILLEDIQTETPVFSDEKLQNEAVTYTFDEDNASFSWGSATIPYNYTIDMDVVKAYVDDWNSTAIMPEDAYFDSETGEFIPEVNGTYIDYDAVVEAIDSDLLNIDVIDDFRLQPNVTSADYQKVLADIDSRLDWSVSYDDGEVFIIPDEALTPIITIENGEINYEFDTTFIDNIISTLAATYDFNNSTSFITTNGENITLNNGTWGKAVDVKAELSAVKEAFENNESLNNRMPIADTSKTDIGNSYVEVSIENQHVWVYIDGNLKMESDCVTGEMDGRHNTPTGAWYIETMMPGKALRPQGSTSSTWVNRWMKVTPDGVGLHDATWRSNFGGQIYIKNGSHGCVNLPKAFAYDLYEVAYEGMPVIIY